MIRRLPWTALVACAVAAVTFAAASAFAGTPSPKGHLVLIGGGEKPPEVMRKFVELAGGKDAPIVMIPTASSEADAASYYEKLFREEYGCTNAISLDIRKKADAQRADWAALARNARHEWRALNARSAGFRSSFIGHLRRSRRFWCGDCRFRPGGGGGASGRGRRGGPGQCSGAGARRGPLLRRRP